MYFSNLISLCFLGSNTGSNSSTGIGNRQGSSFGNSGSGNGNGGSGSGNGANKPRNMNSSEEKQGKSLYSPITKVLPREAICKLKRTFNDAGFDHKKHKYPSNENTARPYILHLEHKDASVNQVREKLEKTLGTKPTTHQSDSGGGMSNIMRIIKYLL